MFNKIFVSLLINYKLLMFKVVIIGILIALVIIGGLVAAFLFALGGKDFPFILRPFYWLLELIWDSPWYGLIALIVFIFGLYLVFKK